MLGSKHFTTTTRLCGHQVAVIVQWLVLCVVVAATPVRIRVTAGVVRLGALIQSGLGSILQSFKPDCACIFLCLRPPIFCLSVGLVAQWITRLTTDQKILGSTPGQLDITFSMKITCSSIPKAIHYMRPIKEHLHMRGAELQNALQGCTKRREPFSFNQSSSNLGLSCFDLNCFSS